MVELRNYSTDELDRRTTGVKARWTGVYRWFERGEERRKDSMCRERWVKSVKYVQAKGALMGW